LLLASQAEIELSLVRVLLLFFFNWFYPKTLVGFRVLSGCLNPDFIMPLSLLDGARDVIVAKHPACE